MRRISLFLILTLLFRDASAAVPTASGASGFRASWLQSRTVTKTTPAGEASTKLFRRFVETRAGAFQAGSVTYLRLPLAARELPKAVEAIREGLGIAAWKIRAQGDARAHEFYWERANRVIRVYTRHDGKASRISVATFRASFADPLSRETELIQRALLGVLDLPSKERGSLERWIHTAWNAITGSLWIPSAHAEGPGCGECAPGDLPCLLAQAGCAGATLAEGVDKFADEAGKIRELVEDLKLNDKWNEAKGMWGEAKDRIDRFTGELHRTNDLAESLLDKLFDPGTILVSAVTAGLGSAMVSLAMEGLSAAGAKLLDLLTGESRRREIRERFAEARKNWEDANARLFEMEHALDGLLALKQLIQKFGISRESLLRLDPLIVRIEARTEAAEAALRDSYRAPGSVSAGCQESLSEQIVELRGLSRNLGRLSSAFSGATNLASADARFCSTLRSLMERVGEAESQLQSYRSRVVDAQAVWTEDWNDEEAKITRSFENAKSSARDAYKERAEVLARRRDDAIAKLKVKAKGRAHDRYVLDCVEERVGHPLDMAGTAWGSGGVPLDGLPSVLDSPEHPAFRFRQECEARYFERDARPEVVNGIRDAKSAYARDLAEADRDLQRSLALPPYDVRAAQEIHDGAYRAFRSWVSSIETAQSQLPERVIALNAKRGKIRALCGAP